MRKAFAWVAVSLATSCVVSVWACSGTPTGSTFGGDTGDSGGPEGSVQFNPDSGLNGDDDGAVPSACVPNLPGSFSPTWTAPTKAAKCTNDDLGGWYDACEADLTAQTCKDWNATHADCGSCIVATNNSGPIQSFRSGLYLTLNVAGCLALSLKDNAALGTNDSCAKAYDAVFQCRRASCDNCFDGAQQSPTLAFQRFNNCENSASCDTYATPEASACGNTAYKDPDGGAPQCFPTAQESTDLKGTDVGKAAAAQKEFYLRVMGITCGP
jgi:hypothetical protein